MQIWKLLLAVLFLPSALGAASSAAWSATIQYGVTFGAGNFTSAPPGGSSPILITGGFNLLLDIGTDPLNQTSGISGTTISDITIDTPWAFSYDSANDILVVGGSATGADLVQFSPATNDFYLQIHDFSTANPLMWQLGYAQISQGDRFFFTPSGGSLANGYVFVQNLGPVSTVPLPAALPLLLTALGGTGLLAVVKRRRTSLAAAT